MRAIILDTETTGTDDDAGIVEAAWLEIDDNYKQDGEVFCKRYNPGKPISLGAMATHHIHDSDLVDCPSDIEFKLPGGIEYLIGHNIDFDWRIVGSPDIKRICTLALARSLWPDIDSHSQTALMYHFVGVEARDDVRKAHSAGEDVQICHTIMLYILRQISGSAKFPNYQELWEASEKARTPTIMSFGKHKGKPVSEVPRDYISWYMRQDDIDPYLVKAFEARR